MKPYLNGRVKTPYSDKTVGTVTRVAAVAGKPVCFVQFDRPCGPGPDSEAWFDSRDLRPVETEEQTASEDYKRINEWWFNRLDEARTERDEARTERDEARTERDEAIEKLRRAVRVLTGVDSTT